MKPRGIKTEIKKLYLKGLTVPQIVTRVKGAKPNTIYRWVKSENWNVLCDEKMQAAIKSPETLLDAIYSLVKTLPDIATDETKLASRADAISKLMKTFKTFAKEQDRLNQVLFVTGELAVYMSDQKSKFIYDEKFRETFDKLLTGFQNEMIKKHGEDNYA